ncbi:ribonuclease E activity regulator RraA [Cupriavidus oxalaticus]|uniref:ribonuclease E activity regulator RraA n=1 Tax=Cupriavidus oxalaticus TaxID=96344 RepID=UPI0040344A48
MVTHIPLISYSPLVMFSTSDLSDEHPDTTSVCQLQFRSFGLREHFAGPCATLRVREDHRPVLRRLSTPGAGRVLVVDVGGSLRIGVFGDRLAGLAASNGWAGLVIHGVIRDSKTVDGIDIGVKALGTTALRNATEQPGAEDDVPLTFGGVTFKPSDWVYCDADAVLVSPEEIQATAPPQAY